MASDQQWFQKPMQPPLPHQQQQQLSTEDSILLLQRLIEPCILKGYTKWEVVAELGQVELGQMAPSIRRELVLEVWAKLEQQNPHFFVAYDQFLRLKAQVADFNEVMSKFHSETKNDAMVGLNLPQDHQQPQFYISPPSQSSQPCRTEISGQVLFQLNHLDRTQSPCGASPRPTGAFSRSNSAGWSCQRVASLLFVFPLHLARDLAYGLGHTSWNSFAGL
ncbi:hypothetical protein BASA81_006178 [Batrachochytrium salamandrivorans]|nr:hypothetical protein BASA81_006178 [Batrachochytrium salamandrivorans]